MRGVTGVSKHFQRESSGCLFPFFLFLFLFHGIPAFYSICSVSSPSKPTSAVGEA